MSHTPSGMAARRRFVFVIAKTGDEVLDGSTVQLNAETAEEAIGRTESWGIVRDGAELSLIGERTGFASGARFIPVVPLEEVPKHILQNERIDSRQVA